MDKFKNYALKVGLVAWASVAVMVAYLVILDLAGRPAEEADRDAFRSQLVESTAAMEALQQDLIELRKALDERDWLSAATPAATSTSPATGALARGDICDRSRDVLPELLAHFGHPHCSLIAPRDLLTIRELSIDGSTVKVGDFVGLDNLETLRLYLDERPEDYAIGGLPQLANFLLEYPGHCGGLYPVNMIHLPIVQSGDNCRVSLGTH